MRRRVVEYRLTTIAELRRRRKLSQKQLAERLGVRQSNVARYEVSDNPHLATLDTIIDGLGGRLVLLAVFERSDRHAEVHMLRMPNDRRRPASFGLIPRTHLGAQPTRTAMLARMADGES